MQVGDVVITTLGTYSITAFYPESNRVSLVHTELPPRPEMLVPVSLIVEHGYFRRVA